MAAEQDRVLTYSGSGVNYDMMDPFKVECQKAAATTGGNLERFDEFGIKIREIPQSRGESGFRMTFEMTRPVKFNLVRVEEGIGSKDTISKQVRAAKLKAAQEAGLALGKSFLKGATVDNGATIFNDMSTSAASPIDLMTFIAAGSSDWFADEERKADIIAGTLEAVNQARSAWGGGESPALRDIINEGHSLLSGSAYGLKFPGQRRDLDEHYLAEGDRIILAYSSGPHANGITLLRTALVDRLPQGYQTPLPNGQTYGEAVLAPTVIYSKLIDGLLDAQAPLDYAVHISGHGWRKLMRAQKEFSYIIDKIPDPQPVFQLIQDVSGMSNEQIYGDYNMGAGFALFTSEGSASRVVEIAEQLGYKTLDAGYVEEGPKRVVIRPVGVEYKGEELQIR